ncbi:hypothetical protein MLD38_019434 [Melastoma candidum]|uniref:Uncharacterized protein n=1 Tax=Melastoma candidum TaxID=119954 RepID=A0ACB9QY36_9MYRT|nr:hypothetical protein MLD38_019434 [Melastoma candidum]
MEGVGARLGRSSTRYGPATVFTGPVRKWKKKWVHVAPTHHHNNYHNHHHHHHHYNSRHHSAASDAHVGNGGSSAATASSNGSTPSHLLLYRWTPISQSGNLNGNSDGEGLDKGSVKEDGEPPRRKFKYIPIAVLEEPSNEEESVGAADADEEVKPSPKNEKPDINDVPMEEEPEDNNQGMRQDLNETLDLTL